jgi:hypothetical protein
MLIERKNLIEPEVCPRCGAEFTCSKSGKCWCFTVSVSETVRGFIDSKYESCLCPQCLNELAALDNSEEIAQKV